MEQETSAGDPSVDIVRACQACAPVAMSKEASLTQALQGQAASMKGNIGVVIWRRKRRVEGLKRK